jgi:AcrR family transcriptional regulator
VTRSIPSDRLRHLVEAAAQTFIARGYRMTQMGDVASALGVAKGTLYLYVESKEALFDLTGRFADAEPTPVPTSLPWPTPRQGATVAYVRERLADQSRELVLVAALQRPSPANAAAEFTEIVRDLYRRMAQNRKSLKLVDRCALDHPELADVWFDEGRWAQHTALVRYIEQRVAEGALRSVTNGSIAARFVLEAIAFWAVHRHWDPSPQTLVEKDVETTLVELLLHGLEKESS